MSTPGRFLREFVVFGRGRIALATGLVLATALVEGLGLLVLVEVLRLAGLDMQGGGLAAAGGVASNALRTVGIAPSLAAVLIAYVAIVAGRGAIERAQTRVNEELEAGFVASLRGRLYRSLTFAGWAFHARSRLADSVHALTQEADRAGTAVYYLLQMTATSALALVYLALALWTSALMTLVVGAAGLALLAIVRHRARTAIATGEAASASGENLYRAIADHLSGLKTAKSYGTEDRHVAAFDALSREVAEIRTRMARATSSVRRRLELGSVVLLGFVLYASREWLRLPVGETLMLAFLFGRLMPRLNELMAQGTTVLAYLPAFRTVTALEDRARAAAESRGPASAAPIAFARELRLDGVTFGYEDRAGVAAVDSIDCTIPAGRTVALVGPSGAGKSTVADLVMGLLRPTRGHVSVDDVAIDGDRIEAWRRQIGYVAQDTFLFHDTVRANLLWAAPAATEAALWTALGQAAAESFVRALPAGLETVVGDRGVLLSGGERQRIALARALLRQPGLLILDEATSALDAENEARVLQAIAGLHGRLTILVISHRLSAVRGADVIYVMEAGRIAESGTWAALTRPGTRFRRLCEVQGLDVAQATDARQAGAGR